MPKKKSDHKKSESLNWEDHKGLVWHIMAKRRSKIEWARVEPEEVAQRLELVVWWCLQPGKYDPKKGRVSTYVCTALLREIDRTIGSLGDSSSLPSLDSSFSSPSSSSLPSSASSPSSPLFSSKFGS